MLLGAGLHSSCTGSFRRPSAPANPYRASVGFSAANKEDAVLFTKIKTIITRVSSETSQLVLMKNVQANQCLKHLKLVWQDDFFLQKQQFCIGFFPGVQSNPKRIGKTPSTQKFISLRFQTHRTQTTYSLHSRWVLASLKAGGSFERGFWF